LDARLNKATGVVTERSNEPAKSTGDHALGMVTRIARTLDVVA
jgi:hypothetical protein